MTGTEPPRPGRAGAAGAQDGATDEDAGVAVDEELLDEDDEPELAGATVLVVPGRPRYHVEGCRYLSGKAVEEVDVLDARAQYSPCGVCKPDAVLEAAAVDVEPEPEPAEAAFDEGADEEVVDAGVPGTEPDAEAEPVPVAPARRRAAATGTRSRTRTPATTARAPRSTGRARAAEPAAEQQVDVAGAAEPAPVAARTATRRGKVVVIPDRGRFHTPECRFVRNVLGTEELTRTQAAKQGYAACGVCKP